MLQPVLQRKALHWLWPEVCAHCREDLPEDALSPLCLGCRLKLLPNEPPCCQRCAEPGASGRAHCGRCDGRLFACQLIRAAFRYEEAAISMVHSFKFRGRREAARAAGSWMAEALPRLPELGRPDALVPMPLHPRRRRERGYNQAELLAEGLSQAALAPVQELARRMRETKPLWALRREQRERELRDAFACPQPERVAGKRLWIIDDVCTSGASLEGCARALLEAGAASVRGFVFARQAKGLLINK
ncbi:MAG: ComF family protein [Elusimicrobia bacterium]|nr:ComF family protein [Elusimicrobiota bacterium]MDE2238009.1 ComF family protein [Elusimicrobiota bacterium]MDE2424292.1 ComF family protein [Elusimicrobiota bacterium]